MTTYYTYDQTTRRLAPAKRTAYLPDGTFVINPTAEQYAAMNPPAYPRGTSAAPTPPEGKVAVFDGYALEDGAWVQQYRFEDAPEPPKPVYDKYKLTLALEKANLLEDFMSFISSDPVLAFKWNAANQLDYEDDMLSNALAAIKEALDVTDEQVAAILAEAEV